MYYRNNFKLKMFIHIEFNIIQIILFELLIKNIKYSLIQLLSRI